MYFVEDVYGDWKLLGRFSVIEIKDAWMRYERDSADVLKGLSLTVRKGEILALVGGNGAGKSTLMTMMAGAAKPYRAKVVRGRHTGG